jgi:glycine cleavage system transcriptional repressor
VYGSDRPGIVHRVASLLADNGVNIVDLSTRVIGDADRPVYAMILEVTFPAAADPAALQARLVDLASNLGVECSLHPSEADIL